MALGTIYDRRQVRKCGLKTVLKIKNGLKKRFLVLFFYSELILVTQRTKNTPKVPFLADFDKGPGFVVPYVLYMGCFMVLKT